MSADMNDMKTSQLTFKKNLFPVEAQRLLQDLFLPLAALPRIPMLAVSKLRVNQLIVIQFITKHLLIIQLLFKRA